MYRPPLTYLTAIVSLSLWIFLPPLNTPTYAGESSINSGEKIPIQFLYVASDPDMGTAYEAVEALANHPQANRLQIQQAVDMSMLGAEEKAALATRHGWNPEAMPTLAVVVGPHAIAGLDGIQAHLGPTVEALLAGRAPPAAATTTPTTATGGNETIQDEDDAVTFWVLTFAGLADGVNPCAFATVILFVSMLSSVGRSRRDILAVGISFIAAVFLAYFAIGLGLYKVIKHISAYSQIAGAIIAIVAILLAVVAGILSLVDAWRSWRTGGKGEMILVLPSKFKDAIRKRLRATAHSHSLLVAAFVAGLIVSLIESACTGQIFFPILANMAWNETAILEAILLLLWYVLMFILPLVAVFVGAFFGISSEAIAKASRRRVWITKLALAAVFFVMAGLLAPSLYYRTYNWIYPPQLTGPADANALRLEFYFTSKCPSCAPTMTFLGTIKERYGPKVRFVLFDRDESEANSDQLFDRLKEAGIAEKRKLVLFVEDHYLGGETAIKRDTVEAIHHFAKEKGLALPEPGENEAGGTAPGPASDDNMEAPPPTADL